MTKVSIPLSLYPLIQTLFAEQLKKYDQLKGYIEQNLAAQDNILKALTEANVQYAPVRKTLMLTEQQYVFVCVFSFSFHISSFSICFRDSKCNPLILS